jgi:Transposase DDE domain group 1
MATECRQDSLDFGTVESRSVVGAFDGGVISSDAGALLLGAVDKAIRLVKRFAACFTDRREPESIEHTTTTLVGQRVIGIALGYEDLNDHDLQIA